MVKVGGTGEVSRRESSYKISVLADVSQTVAA